MMTYILAHNAANPTQALSEGEMVANSMALIIGGSDTLTTALAFTLNNLFQHPTQLSILVIEIRTAFKSEIEIDGRSTRSLKHLTAVLRESLRLCPPFADNLHRAVPAGGAVIAGHNLSHGVTVGVPCYAMFRSGRNFSSPDAFLPQRWLATLRFRRV